MKGVNVSSLSDEQKKAIEDFKNISDKNIGLLFKLFNVFDNCFNSMTRFIKISWFLSVTTWVTTEILMKKVWIMNIDPLTKGLMGSGLLLGYLLFLMDNLKRL